MNSNVLCTHKLPSLPGLHTEPYIMGFNHLRLKPTLLVPGPVSKPISHTHTQKDSISLQNLKSHSSVSVLFKNTAWPNICKLFLSSVTHQDLF